MAFRITRSVFPLAVRPVGRAGVGAGAGFLGTSEMGIDIIDVHDDTGGRRVRRKRRAEPTPGTVEPNGRVPDADLTMDRLALSVTHDASCLEPERLDQKIVSRLDILICE